MACSKMNQPYTRVDAEVTKPLDVGSTPTVSILNIKYGIRSRRRLELFRIGIVLCENLIRLIQDSDMNYFGT